MNQANIDEYCKKYIVDKTSTRKTNKKVVSNKFFVLIGSLIGLILILVFIAPRLLKPKEMTLEEKIDSYDNWKLSVWKNEEKTDKWWIPFLKFTGFKSADTCLENIPQLQELFGDEYVYDCAPIEGCDYSEEGFYGTVCDIICNYEDGCQD